MMTHTHTHPTCCCLQWISDLSPLRRQQDTHARSRGCTVCEIDQDAGQIFTDELMVRLLSYIHSVCTTDSSEAAQSAM